MAVPAAMLLGYLYFVYNKTKGDDETDDPCSVCPLTKTVPVAAVAPPPEHCGEDLRTPNVAHPDDAVRGYHMQQEADTFRKLSNPELEPVLRSLNA